MRKCQTLSLHNYSANLQRYFGISKAKNATLTIPLNTAFELYDKINESIQIYKAVTF